MNVRSRGVNNNFKFTCQYRNINECQAMQLLLVFRRCSHPCPIIIRYTYTLQHEILDVYVKKPPFAGVFATGECK